MLLSPQAVRRLKDVTAYNNWPNTTHEQRNELARMFNEEAGRLLDQKAESTVKHVVELHSSGDITFERYIELIEEISREEETRGAAHGGEYARNRVFEFAQKALDRAKDRAHALQLSDAKRQYELEKRKTEQGLREVVQQGMVDVKTAVQQHDADLKATAHEQKAGLVQDQERLVAHTKTEIEQVILARLQEERARREREIHEEEAARPAREAARTAIARIADLE
ncbi:MAG: hypothetical protein J2P37_22775, partial [Ktedonobacteraceae bacterium]|nr:hypothetical protein [Ktedonobacteraceae bacterium]